MKERIITPRVPVTWSHLSQPGSPGLLTATFPVAVPVGRPPPPSCVLCVGVLPLGSRLRAFLMCGAEGLSSGQAASRWEERGRERVPGRGARCDGEGPDAALKTNRLTVRNGKRRLSGSSVQGATHSNVLCDSLFCFGKTSGDSRGGPGVALGGMGGRGGRAEQKGRAGCS